MNRWEGRTALRRGAKAVQLATTQARKTENLSNDGDQERNGWWEAEGLMGVTHLIDMLETGKVVEEEQ